ncbi:MAG: RND transporter, partial [Nocardioides sp.]
NQTAGAAQDMLAQISGRRDGYRRAAMIEARHQGLSAARVRAAGQRATAEFDERYGALLVRGLPAGLPTLKNPRFVETVMFDDQGNPRAQWHFVVPTPRSVALLVRPRADLDQAGASRLTAAVRAAVDDSTLDLSRSTVTGVPVVSAALTDRARQELPRLGALSVGAVGLVFLLLPWTSRRRSRVRPTLAALVGTAATVSLFGWFDHPLSLGVVAFLPILLGIGSDFPLYLSRGGRDRQVLVAAVAGVMGFASLLLSPLPFVRELGLALALGISLTIGVALALRWLLGPVPAPRAETAGAEEPVAPPGRTRRALVAVVVLAASAAGWAVLPGLAIEAQPEQLAQGLPELGDAEYAEQVLGSTGEVSIVLRGDDVATPEVLSWSRGVQTRIVTELGDRVHPVLSLADLFRFLGDEPTPEQVQAALAVMPRYLTSAVLRSDGTEGLMVMGVEFDDVAELGRLLDGVEAATADPPAGVEVDVVGLPVAAVRGLHLVSDGRLAMNFAGIAAAALVLLVGLRSRRDALRGVLTIVLATGWVAALAWATTGSLNPLTVAIGSLTTATACEFAVMLGSGARGRSARTVATAALAGTVGYLVLSFSELAVLRDFGLLLAASVGCSFLAALVVTRVLLPDTPPSRNEPGAAPAPQPREEVLV